MMWNSVIFLAFVQVFCLTVVFTTPVQLNEASHFEDDCDVELPFDKIVVFGDDYSDNGQGSYAHGTTRGSKNWGSGTWTDGPVAVSYLAQQLDLPITYDYAFGSATGGSKVGSVCDISAVNPDQLKAYAHLPDGLPAPDALSQINNYTSNAALQQGMSQTLHILWTGNNDMIASLGWVGRFTICTDGKCVPSQQKFLTGLGDCLHQSLQNLITAGAKHILVPNIYPRHLSPWTSLWITSEPGHVANFGSVIDQANTNLKATIAALGAQNPDVKILYFDANGWIQKALQDPALSGVGPGHGGAGAGLGYPQTCVDGCEKLQAAAGISNWDLFWTNTVAHKQPDDFFWLTEVVVSTTVHSRLAGAMHKFLMEQF